MAALVRVLIGALMGAVGSWVGRVLLSLGIGYVTYKGVDVATGFLLDQIKSGFAGLPADVASFFAFVWLDKAIGMVFSTWTACTAASGLASGLTKFRIKGAA
jgi:hypothetical protein